MTKKLTLNVYFVGVLSFERNLNDFRTTFLKLYTLFPSELIVFDLIV